MGALRQIGLVVAAVAAVGMAAPAGVEATDEATRAIAIRWDGERCREAAAGLASEVASLVRLTPETTPLEVRGSASGESNLRLELLLSREGVALGRRTFEGAECAELLSAAALVVALIIDPAADAMTPEAPPAIPAEAASIIAARAGPRLAEALSSPAQRNTSAPHAARRASSHEAIRRARASSIAADETEALHASDEDAGERSSLGLSLGISAILDVGTLPNAAPGIEGRLGLALGPLRLEASARYIPDQESALGQHPTARGRFGMAAGSLGACLPVGFGPVLVGPCLGLEAGAVWGATSGVSAPGAASSPWLAPWASGLLAVDIAPWLRLRMDVGVVVPVVRTEFVVDGLGPVHDPSAIALRLGLGAEVHFR